LSTVESLSTSISPFVNGINLTMAPDPQQPCVDYDALRWPLAVLYSVIFALGLLGNLVALWALFHVRSKRNSVRVFLINVAFADLLLVVCLPFRILYHARGNVWTLGPTLCNVVGNFFYMNMYISITLLGLISVDRYLKIHRGTLAQSSWPFAEQKKCFHYKELHDAKWKAYINICMLLVFWLVFISLVVSYVKIALKLLRRSQNKPDLPNAHRYSRTARKSFFILFLFTVCFVPYHVIRVFYIKTQITDTSCFWKGVADKANELALLFSALNTCLDPVLLLLLLSSVRKEVRRLMGNMFRHPEPVASQSQGTQRRTTIHAHTHTEECSICHAWFLECGRKTGVPGENPGSTCKLHTGRPELGSNLVPLHCEVDALTTGPPGRPGEPI
uniref:G protein-coupled receptor 34b n=1 Tax=Hippocampus comes TaxID=109280 RepID=A0A3Q2Z624_HIPCM